MLAFRSESPRWPQRLQECCRELRSTADEAAKKRVLEEAWKILNLGLSISLRYHASYLGQVTREDLEDLAADKSLDLLSRIVHGETDLADRHPGEVTNFLSKVARNALLNLIKEAGRRVQPANQGREEVEIGDPGERAAITAGYAPDLQVERQEFARALVTCAGRLDARSRLVWLLRVFYGMSSKDIAVHPEVCLKAAHVDVLLQRSRRAIRECLHRQGFERQDMPPGAFAELWEAFRPESTHGHWG